MTKYFLGIDGGGSKTEFIIIDEKANIMARHCLGSSYYLQIGISGLEKLLFEGVCATIERANINLEQISFAFFGMPAFGEDANIEQRLAKLPSSFLSVDKYICGNDMICGWAGSLACADGINIVAGTGSIAYGENGNKAARAGGFGELFGDEGSAYWIGIQTLNYFSKMADGRLPKTSLYKLICDYFSLSNPLDICAVTMGPPQMSRDEIAGISKLTFEALKADDECAKSIFCAAALQLSQIIDAVANQLDFALGNQICLSYSGGVFKSGEAILKPLEQFLSKTNKNYFLQPPKFSPVIGAALYAAKIAKHQFKDSELSALKS